MIKGNKLEAHILAHCVVARVSRTVSDAARTRVYPDGFYKVVTPLHVFKKVHHEINGHKVDAIANLIIPVGALIFAPHYSFWAFNSADGRKMRASEAEVHSIVTKRAKKQVNIAIATRCRRFEYKVGTTVKPELRFSRCGDQCESGIHFFVNLADAKSW
jgi:hypothetical protein